MDLCPVKPDVFDDIRTLAGLQKKVRRLYATIQNNKTIQKKFRTIVQPLLETRYAWEHFSDALLDEEDEWNIDTKRLGAEMEKAREHSLRCYTDLTEWRFLQIKVYARNITKWLTKDDIQSAIPGYYAEVFPLYSDVEKTIVKLKKTPEQNFDARISLLDQANDNCDFILEALNENALKELRRKSSVFSALKIVGTAVAGAVITLLVQYLFQLAQNL